MLPENQIPLSIGLPSKHLWKVRNWSNKLQHETLCSPGWTGCLIAGIHLLPSPIFTEPSRPKNLSQTQPFSSSTDFELSLISSSHFILTLLLVWFPLPHIRLDLQGKGLSLIRLSFSRDQDNLWSPFISFLCLSIHSSMYSTANAYRYGAFCISDTVLGTRNAT